MSESRYSYCVLLQYDGMVRRYYCEFQLDTVVLFDALYKGVSWDYLEVYDTRNGKIIQSIRKPA